MQLIYHRVYLLTDYKQEQKKLKEILLRKKQPKNQREQEIFDFELKKLELVKKSKKKEIKH